MVQILFAQYILPAFACTGILYCISELCLVIVMFLCFCLSFWCFLSFFPFFFWGVVYRSAEICCRFWVGNNRRKTNKQTKQNIFSLKWEKKGGTIQAYFYLSVQSSLACNVMAKWTNLKNDICIKILNDRYRSIDLYVFKKKQNKTKEDM